MNCCDYKCDQGRNCPARAGQRALLPEPLEQSVWRQELTWLAKVVLFTFAAWVVSCFVVLAYYALK
jgi:hypothetical protein